MERNAREYSSPKRGRKALSGGSEAEVRSPLHKKPKYRCPSPDAENSSSTSTEDDKEDRQYVEDLVSIRNVAEDLQLMEREFYQEQQKQYEHIQSLGREFHISQQKRYSELTRRISDIERRLSEDRLSKQRRKVRILRQEKKKNERKEEDKKILLQLKDQITKSIMSDNGDVDRVGDHAVEEGIALTPPTIRTLLAPPRTINHRKPSKFPKGTYESEYETESSQEEEEEEDPLRTTVQQVRGSSLTKGVRGQGQVSKPTSPSKLVARRPHNRHVSGSPTPVTCIDSSDGDDEDDGLSEDPQIIRPPQFEASQSSGILNEDGAIEGIETRPRPLEVGVEEQQRRSPSATLSLGQDQTRFYSTDGNTTPTSNRAENSAPHPGRSGRSFRKRRKVNYKEIPPTYQSDEEGPPDHAKTPTKKATKKTTKTPVGLKSKKKDYESDNESYHPDSAKESTIKESTIKEGTAKKKNVTKFNDGMKQESMFKFISKSSPTKTMGGRDNYLSPIVSSNGSASPTPANSNPSSQPGTLQHRLGTQSKSRSIGAFSQAPKLPPNIPVTSYPQKAFEGLFSDPTVAPGARYKAVKTATSS